MSNSKSREAKIANNDQNDSNSAKKGGKLKLVKIDVFQFARKLTSKFI